MDDISKQQPTVQSLHIHYLKKLLEYKKYQLTDVGRLFKISGFDDYNHILDINSVFSTDPNFLPIDRTHTTKNPIKWANVRNWTVPACAISLETALEQIVKRLSALDKKINVFWSGGIDSTAIVTSFLQNLTDRSQLRIIYSPWSCYEHPEYLNFLKKFPEVELIDQSGELYLDLSVDGIHVSGNSGDEIHASIDQSFYLAHGHAQLHKSWRDFFYKRNNNDAFIDFCETHFKSAGFEITSVLEARWWFYTSCKIDSLFRNETIPLLLSNKTHPVSVDDIYGFFNCAEYEQYIYWNISSIIKEDDYKTWKMPLKQYCYNFDKIESWYLEKEKFHSTQIGAYKQKKIALNDQRHIAILSDNQKIATPNLPFFSQLEFENKYGNTLDYIFNDPD